MFELDSAHFGDVLPLYRELGLDFPLICEVIVRRQRGQIFVDRRDVPRSALVLRDSDSRAPWGRTKVATSGPWPICCPRRAP